MPISIESALGKPVTIPNVIEGDKPGESLNVTYNPEAITLDDVDAVKNLKVSEDARTDMGRLFDTFKIDWDLLDQNKKRVIPKLRPEGAKDDGNSYLNDVPISILATVLSAVTGNKSPKAKNTKASRSS